MRKAKLQKIGIILLIALALVATSAALLTTDKETYALGDKVTIWAQLSEGEQLSIITPDGESYVYMGAETRITYTPTDAGSYSLQIKQGEIVEEEKAFTVLSVISLPSETTGLFHTDKESYVLGETVNIYAKGMQPDYELIISFEKNEYRYLGELDEAMTYIPAIPGKYSLILKSGSQVIAETAFRVIGPTALLLPQAIQRNGIMPALIARKQNFKTSEKAEFKFEFSGGSAARYSKSINKWESANETITATVKDSLGELVDIPVEISQEADGKFNLAISGKRTFKPGKYILSLQLLKNGTIYIQQQDFTWGVLAINTNKSIFLPDEDAFIAMAVLDDEGHMVCDANVSLVITDPNGIATMLTTESGGISVSGECMVYDITKLPDYYATYKVGGAGAYALNLTAITKNGVRTISDSFLVEDSVEFDVARNAHTRIYPILDYNVTFTINANGDYSGPVEEYVPSGFYISPQQDMTVRLVGDTKILSWNRNFKAGETYTLSYKFNAPDTSPEFYLLGPLTIGNWSEARQWQIASDKTLGSETMTEPTVPQSLIGGQTFTMTCTPSCSGSGGFPSVTHTYQWCSDAACTTPNPISIDPGTAEALSLTTNPEAAPCNGGVSETVTARNAGSVYIRCFAIEGPRSAASSTLLVTVQVPEPPNNSIERPGAYSNISGIFLVNASLNSSLDTVQAANLSILSSTGIAAGPLPMSLGAGTATSGYWNITFDSTSLEDGFYNLSVNGTDSGGRPRTSANISIIIDNTKANVSSVQPANMTNTSQNFLIRAYINDSQSKIFNVAYRLINPQTIGSWLAGSLSSGTISSGYWDNTVDISGVQDGFYNITVNATDFAGNQQIVNISSVIIDRLTPNASIIVPLNRTNLSSNFLVNVSVNDSISKVFNATFRLINSQSDTGWLYASRNSGSILAGYWNTTVDISALSSGIYNISVNATDFAGNQQLANISEVVIDKVLPNATIITPINNTNLSSNFLINASVNDSLSQVFNATFRIINSGAATGWLFASRGAGSAAVGYWNTTADISGIIDGIYNITINATDFAGNQNLVNISEVVIDRLKPNASAIVPLNGTNITGSFLVNASVNDSLSRVFNATFRLISPQAATAWVYASLGAGNIGVGYWNATFDVSALDDGAYNITVNATDFAGNQNLVNISEVVIDRVPANASIILPLNNTNLTSDFLVNASVNDSLSGIFNATFRLISASAASDWLYASLGAGSINVGYWNTTVNVALLSDDIYNITVNATDFAGNQILANISQIILDRARPNISAVVPVNVTNISTSFLINASVNDSPSRVFNTTFRLINSTYATAWLYASISAGDFDQGYWNTTADISGLGDGLYNISANATDFAGNEALANISEVLIDRVYANVSGIAPINGSVQEAFVLINASVNDTSSKVWKVLYRLINGSYSTDWVDAELNTGTIDQGYWAVEFNTVIVSNALYNISINAIDFAGNQRLVNISNIEVLNIVDDIAPNLTIIKPVAWANVSASFLVNASINDTYGYIEYVNFTLFNSSGNVTAPIVMSLGEGSVTIGYWNTILSTLNLVDGIYNVSINATDSSGNANLSENVSIIVDNTKANASAVSPENDSIFRSDTFVMNASVNDTLTKVFNATFRLISAQFSTSWIYASLGSGNIDQGYWNASFDSATVNSGFYNITINATDFAGNQMLANISQIIIDRIFPNASTVFPLNNTNFTSDFLVNASVNDSLSRVFNATFRLISPQAATAWLDASLGSGTDTVGFWNTTVYVSSLDDGFYNITINATDFAGNQVIANISQIAIDRAAPNASAILPINSTNITSNFLVRASVNDSVTGVLNATYRLINSEYAGEWAAGTLSSGTSSSGYWDATLDISGLPEGFYNISINATDFAGNQNLVNISEVVIDRVKPNASAIVPLNNTNFTSNFLVNASVNDSLSRVFNVTFRLINPTASTGWLFASMNSGNRGVGYWNTTVDVSGLDDGTYNITVNATDFAGNQNLANISEIVIDRLQPNTSAIVPLNNTNISGSFLINASVNDSLSGVFNATFRLISPQVATAWLYASLGAGSIGVGYWNTTVDSTIVLDGVYNITINATDFAGNQKVMNISEVVIDNTKANASIILPVNNTNVSSAFLINASVNDSLSKVFNATFRLINSTYSTAWLYVSINSGTNAVGFWNTTADISSLADGKYNITVNATDFAGNQNLVNISFVNIDRLAPNVSGIAPANGSTVAGFMQINASANDTATKVKAVSFRLINSDSSTITSWLSAELNSGTIDQGYWNTTFDTELLGDGNYNITIDAVDFAGNHRIVNISAIIITNNEFIAAGEKSAVLLRAQGCNREVSATSATFTLACAGTYPGACPADRLSCSDGTSEISSLSNNNIGGVNITSYNRTVTDCYTIKSVSVCYNWTSASSSHSECYIAVDIAGDLTWNGKAITCPTTTPSGVICEDVTGMEDWLCSNFFGASAAGARAFIEAKRIGSPATNLYIDAFYFNLTYTKDKQPPSIGFVNPVASANISGSFLVNASINDTALVEKANLTIYNSTGNATTFMPLTLSSGTLTIGYWNLTFDSTILPDGFYNLSINASDPTRNINITNLSITIDNTKPNASAVTPLNNSLHGQVIQLNASANDSISKVLDVSFRLISSSDSTSWDSARINSGNIGNGYWNASIDSTTLQNGLFNVTVNVTDFAGNEILANISSINVTNTNLNISDDAIVMLNSTLASEYNNITINATVWNIGTADAASFTVAFFEVSTGIEILISNTTVESLAAGAYTIVNTTYVVKAGFNNITVRVNSNYSITEYNYSNNEANISFYVSSYSFYYGNFTTTYVLGNFQNATIINWGLDNSTGNVYVADADSIVDFSALQAFGRTISGSASSNDFTEADTLLGSSGLTDSLASVYTTDGNTPKETAALTVYGDIISNIPMAESISSANFKTGILWDTSKDTGDLEYDAIDSEPLILAVEVTLPKQATCAFCSYEIRVPANLRSYHQPDNQNSVSFYKEIV